MDEVVGKAGDDLADLGNLSPAVCWKKFIRRQGAA
jgi:hypothetical protein